MKNLLLAVSDINSQNNTALKRPKKDYERLAELANARIEFPIKSKNKPFGLKIFEKLTALDISQAVQIIRKHKNLDVIISFSEKIGIPLSILLKNKKTPKHIMIAHKLDTNPKKILNKYFLWSKRIDKLIVICTSQLETAKQFCGERSELILAGVTDDEFFTPNYNLNFSEKYILSVGKENRDYETLIKAAKEIECKIKILANSPWTRKNKKYELNKNSNIEFLPTADYNQLLELYHKSLFTILPLNNVSYAAGHNGLLESMCVGKVAIVSKSDGIVDYISNDSTVIKVDVGNVEQLQNEANRLLNNNSLRNEIGKNARKHIEDCLSQKIYCKKLLSIAENEL